MKYLDYNKTNVPLYISAPIFEQNDGKCDVWEKFKFIRDSQEWKDGNGRLFSITDKTKELKVNRKRTKSKNKLTKVAQVLLNCKEYMNLMLVILLYFPICSF
jgi:hypothetical protein